MALRVAHSRLIDMPLWFFFLCVSVFFFGTPPAIPPAKPLIRPHIACPTSDVSVCCFAGDYNADVLRLFEAGAPEGKSGERVRKNNEPIRRSLTHCRVEDRLESQGRGFQGVGLFFMLGFRWRLLASSGLSMDGIWMGFGEKKLISPSFRHTMCGGGAGMTASDFAQFSTFCLDRSVSPSLFLGKLTGKCVGEEDIVDQVGEHLTLAHRLPPNRLTQWRSSSTELRHRESFNKWGDLNPRGNK